MKKFCALALVVLLTLLLVPAAVSAQTPDVIRVERQGAAGSVQVSGPARSGELPAVVAPSRATQPPAGVAPDGEETVVVKQNRTQSVTPVVNSNRNIPQPVELRVTPAEMSLKVGQSKQFQAALTFSDGSVKDVTRDAVFVVSNRRVASVRNGRVDALAPGTATVQVLSYGKTAAITVTVQEPEPPKVEIPVPVNLTVEPAEISIKAGESRQFKATVAFSDGTVKDVTRDAVFVVSNSRVAKVSGGNITGLAPGSAAVQVVSYGKTAVITVKVEEAVPPANPDTPPAIPTPVSLEIDPASITLQVGQSAPFRAAVRFSDGTVRDVTRNAVFVVSNSRVARVGNGYVTALSQGTALVTVRSYGKTGTITVRAEGIPAGQPGVEKKVLQWRYGKDTYSLEVAVPKTLIDWDREVRETVEKFFTSDAATQQQMLNSMPPNVKQLVLASSASAQGDLRSWVLEPQNMNYISSVASALKQKAAGLNRYETAQMVSNMVQTIPYRESPYPQLSAQTLLDGGDCDAKSILLAAILKNMGYDTALLYYSPVSTGKSYGHVALGIAFRDDEIPGGYQPAYYVSNGKKYYTVETTAYSPIGLPIGYSLTEIYPID
ncbi:Ig domain protein group 2 domain protein [Desulfofundulus kuznetsovii DSM 6115]|uniref:Ig domain protein group 2 domain protein n=1 Tax=Desulfofundulus kuznetsovii (strain DSM 6115 / VKM B-1805 / 17) TaxID=760568 RepID=A0AAU8P987_DESK7|nr:Ig domain protein group 2 domain protein [Desulfofundulus kuznetsovii DSM 6115]